MISKRELGLKRFLELVREHPGILQSEIWKKLKISDRLCSEIAIELEQRGIISREPVTVKGTRTYRINYLGISKPAPKPRLNYPALYIGSKLAPCIGCNKNCDQPEICPELDSWLQCWSEDSGSPS